MIAEINKLPVGLRQPMDEELAWELLWNDPLRFVCVGSLLTDLYRLNLVSLAACCTVNTGLKIVLMI